MHRTVQILVTIYIWNCNRFILLNNIERIATKAGQYLGSSADGEQCGVCSQYLSLCSACHATLQATRIWSRSRDVINRKMGHILCDWNPPSFRFLVHPLERWSGNIPCPRPEQNVLQGKVGFAYSSNRSSIIFMIRSVRCTEPGDG